MGQARTSRVAAGDGSTIGSGARIRGRVTGDGDLMIAGEVEGDILVRGDVHIADGATCTSNVEGHEVTVSGTLSGDVSASGAITIGPTARVRGNVSAKGGAISIEDGASFAGRVDCDFELPDGLGEAPAPVPAARRR
jgi:cytoskeletal protein CcmA (bactofilin family)